MVHTGNNIAKLRSLRRIPQKEMASKLGMTQPEYSRIEQKEQIDDDLLERIADLLEVSVDAIRNFNEAAAINIISATFNSHDNSTSISHQAVYNFNPVEKIVELYERLLKEKDEAIEMYKKQQNAS